MLKKNILRTSALENKIYISARPSSGDFTEQRLKQAHESRSDGINPTFTTAIAID